MLFTIPCRDDTHPSYLPDELKPLLESLAVNTYVEFFPEGQVLGPALVLLQAVVEDKDVPEHNDYYLGECFMPLGMPENAVKELLSWAPLLVA